MENLCNCKIPYFPTVVDVKNQLYMPITIKWRNLAINPKIKQTEIPDHATNIHLECGGWYSTNDVYLWWNEYGNDKCRKLVTSKWPHTAIKKVEKSLEIIPNN